MTSGAGKMPSSQVLKAMRRLNGIGLEMGLPQAVRIVTDALVRGVEMPRSSALVLGRLALDSTMDLARGTRILAAKAVAPFGELETVKRAACVIGSDDAPRDVVEAAAVILMRPPGRKLSTKTVARLRRIARRYALVRGPIVELLLLAASKAWRQSKCRKRQ